ncbi:MAG: Phosphoglucomutase [Chlamydiia bacterium]|nr:Phosphoglucomutase [Chlamydiia bacterium]
MTAKCNNRTELAKQLNLWIEEKLDPTYDEVIRANLDSPENLQDEFGGDITFGTAGLRAIMGPGTNRINNFTIRRATQGLANYIHKNKSVTKPVVAIGYDSRHHSKEFAEETARVLAGNDIDVLISPELCPTPLVSFATRHKKCIASVMITASHNPKEYNGYKVFWSDGAQVVPPQDKGVIDEVNKITSVEDIHAVESVNHPRIRPFPKEIKEAYTKAISKLAHFPDVNRKEGKKLKICYTACNGAGITMIPDALKAWGFTNLNLVEEQCTPDGDFPTFEKPNPELVPALRIGIEQLEQNHSDILLASDPDSDRVSITVNHKGAARPLTGDETMTLCLYYLLSVLKERNQIPRNGGCITTIVSTRAFAPIADHFGIESFDVLTGFKYIGEMMTKWENESGGKTFIFGGEESIGYLNGTHVRDKDAVSMSCLLAEMALYYKLKGMTLVDQLNAIYAEFGTFYDAKDLIASDKGQKFLIDEMSKIRQNPPTTINDRKVIVMEDYLTREGQNRLTKAKWDLTLPKTNLLIFKIEGDINILIRPSGTEPEIKIYFQLKSEPTDQIETARHTLKQEVESLKEAVRKTLFKNV